MKTDLEKPVALVDLDGTLVNYDDGLEKIARKEGLVLDAQNRETYRNILSKIGGFWENLTVLQRGFEVLSVLKSMDFRIEICTKASVNKPDSWTEKINWCNKVLNPILGKPDLDYGITVTTNKSLVYGRVLFDDYPDYCEGWLEHRPRGLVIQVLHDYNKDYRKDDPRVIKYDGTNIIEVTKALSKVKRREGVFGK